MVQIPCCIQGETTRGNFPPYSSDFLWIKMHTSFNRLTLCHTAFRANVTSHVPFSRMPQTPSTLHPPTCKYATGWVMDVFSRGGLIIFWCSPSNRVVFDTNRTRNLKKSITPSCHTTTCFCRQFGKKLVARTSVQNTRSGRARWRNEATIPFKKTVTSIKKFCNTYKFTKNIPEGVTTLPCALYFKAQRSMSWGMSRA